MDNMITGKFVRTDTVVGIVYSPVIEEFFKDRSTGEPSRMRLLPHGEANLYPVNRSLIENLSIPRSTGMALRPEPGNVNLNFLRAEGLGDPGVFEQEADLAIQKWRPPEAAERERWEEFLVERGYEKDNPPSPPGVIVKGCEAKYSNKAVEDVMAQVKSCADTIYREFMQPSEFAFKIEVTNNE